jgi:hypothetical protein
MILAEESEKKRPAGSDTPQIFNLESDEGQENRTGTAGLPLTLHDVRRKGTVQLIKYALFQAKESICKNKSISLPGKI